MPKNRLEAFSDGVIAIIITIMVLELKVPHGASFAALQPLLPVFLSYVLSFIYLGIYWNNHHHLLHCAPRINGTIMWANLHLLFWLSLLPFVTGWAGENHFEALPSAVYGAVLLLAAIAYTSCKVSSWPRSIRARPWRPYFDMTSRARSLPFSTRPRSGSPFFAHGSRSASMFSLRSCGSFPIAESSAP